MRLSMRSLGGTPTKVPPCSKKVSTSSSEIVFSNVHAGLLRSFPQDFGQGRIHQKKQSFSIFDEVFSRQGNEACFSRSPAPHRNENPHKFPLPILLEAYINVLGFDQFFPVFLVDAAAWVWTLQVVEVSVGSCSASSAYVFVFAFSAALEKVSVPYLF